MAGNDSSTVKIEPLREQDGVVVVVVVLVLVVTVLVIILVVVVFVAAIVIIVFVVLVVVLAVAIVDVFFHLVRVRKLFANDRTVFLCLDSPGIDIEMGQSGRGQTRLQFLYCLSDLLLAHGLNKSVVLLVDLP